jgi:hypothetical protein
MRTKNPAINLSLIEHFGSARYSSVFSKQVTPVRIDRIDIVAGAEYRLKHPYRRS